MKSSVELENSSVTDLVRATSSRGLPLTMDASIDSKGVRPRLDTLVLKLLGASSSTPIDDPTKESMQKSTAAVQQSSGRRSTCGW